ncbi:toxin-antitoxin system YwqK family antitoxin [Bacteroides sp. 519]|uniref:toxin-antitoxin system YwqK family antitoxin n=1 Tax=Bacteroides sp. 519 TaxID=2302937 RepID=UPI0013D822E4|nr:hypothetical protein [Bacteroides sp. 519]NDV59674.1 hypothetical protein [Bacteroides sp. 519]
MLKRYINIIVFILLLMNSCKYSANQDKQVGISTEQAVVPDSINPYGDLVRIYGKDSLCTYSPDGILKYIEYLDVNTPIHFKFYSKDGFLERIEYNMINSNLISEEFYLESGILKYRESIPDSSFSQGTDRLRECFYENGKLKFVKKYSSRYAQNGPVGLQKYYSPEGNIIKTEDYIYPIEEKPYIIIIEYYDNGKLKSEKSFYNNAIFESDEIDPKGTWKYYDKNGVLISTEEYGK